MQMKNSPLEALLVSENQVAEDVVAGALSGLVSIVRESGGVLANPPFGKLDINSKIVAYLLALRAAALLGMSQTVSVDADDIAQFIGLDPQRTRENLSRLKRRMLQKTADGWQLPPARVPLACEELLKKRNGK